MHVTIGVTALYQLVVALVIQDVGFRWFDVAKFSREHQTFVFNVFVFGALFHMFNCRKLYDEVDVFEGFERSKAFLGIVAFCVLFQFLAVETFGDFMDVTRLHMSEWTVTIMLTFFNIPLGMASRCIPVKEPVFKREFDPDNNDEDAKQFLLKLAKDVEHTADARAGRSGEAVNKATHARILSLWFRVYAEHVERLKVVNAFRRAYLDRDMNSELSHNVYKHMLRLTSSKA
ncbi:putative vacuolar-type Ca2 -ATPase [Leptomonas seymouri]|uniref:Putative vacuolar-type Ca2-ATPase n=1 Tax=Leptomonas seymouri TaxID=5684 RepID=A0A0N1IH90_LEPSE|nr:putative vacuolar-type Ca2 -ATPase [Leptomonas seymouri]|eukprot:KPI82755.1 putative vacuolar-type Ca2 -ATPase [Leptomonas seymouri]